MSSPLLSILFHSINQRKRAKELVMSSPNGIVEQGFTPIGGIEQWISIRGEDRANPVLLLLHGGPASTYSVFIPTLQPWERHYTVVQWDQRGAGKTLRKNGDASVSGLSFERLAQDAIEVIEYLRRRLGKDQIVLLGSSVGSLIGVMVAQRRPDMLSVFVGTDQNGPDTLDLSHQLTIARLRETGNTKGVKAVEDLWRNRPSWTPHNLNDYHQWVLKASATMGIPNFALDVIFPAMMSSPNHTLRDVRDIVRGMKLSLDALFHELMSFDLRRYGNSFAMPFYVFQGDSDLFTPAAAAKAYVDDIQAPQKTFVLIKNSGHLAAFTRPDQFLQELLLHVRPLALGLAQTPRVS
ncbi:MAG: proline imino-peptidase [Ktedonobacterales bacterium]|jgi:pimeloyl-ACP methyl ester carboxylesterase|nr:MAG: proline imino-peptidase [Ktedonobacterales bacterium]